MHQVNSHKTPCPSLHLLFSRGWGLDSACRVQTPPLSFHPLQRERGGCAKTRMLCNKASAWRIKGVRATLARGIFYELDRKFKRLIIAFPFSPPSFTSALSPRLTLQRGQGEMRRRCRLRAQICFHLLQRAPVPRARVRGNTIGGNHDVIIAQ